MAHSLQGRMCRCPVAGRLHMAGSFRVASAAESRVARAACLVTEQVRDVKTLTFHPVQGNSDR